MNQYYIDDMLRFPNWLSSLPPLQDGKDITYNPEPLFVNILIEDTINYVLKQIYIHKNLTPFCTTLIFRRLLVKLATECTLKLNKIFLKQVDGFAMGGTLYVTFS